MDFMTRQGKITVALVLLMALAVGAFFGWKHYNTTYIRMGGENYRRDVTQLDLSGKETVEVDKILQLQNLTQLNLKQTNLTTAQYDKLSQAMSYCEILWDVPFQGGYVDCNTTELSVNQLAEADIAVLKYLPGLTKVDAMACSDLPMIEALIQAYPDLEVSYQVTIAGTQYDPAVTELNFTGIDPNEVTQNLKYLPNVTYVEFTDEGLDFDALIALVQAYPEVTFQFPMDFLGQKVHFLDTFVDISNTQLESVDEVAYLASVMPKLEKVDMLNCGISNEEMGALNDQDDDTLFVWLVDFGKFHQGYRTDIDQFIPVKQGYWLNDEDLYNLRYCTEIVGLDLGHHLMKNIDFVQYMPKLRYLIIADTRVTDITPVTGLENLIFFEMFGSLVEDYSPLLTLTGLEDLNLSYTRGDPNIVAQMTWLKRLWWRDFPGLRITLEEQQMLQSALPHVQMRFDAGSSTGEGWRDGYLYFEMRDFFGMDYMTE